MQVDPVGSVSVRQAYESDVRDLVSLSVQLEEYHHALDRRLGPGVFTTEVMEFIEGKVRRSLSGPEELTLVAQKDNELIGFAAMRFAGTTEFPTVRLHSLFVVACARRGGVGRRLVEAAMQVAAQRKAKSISVSVAAGNGAAIDFYGRIQFEVVSTQLSRRLG